MAMNRKLLCQAVALGLASIPGTLPAQDVVEMVTVGKMRSAADDVMIERQESPVVADYIDTTMISRLGDSNVADALRRVPGVTLVDDKFVFVRGLGERYSTSLLNGAQIPSPDLTRNVIPLDIFPTSILRSVEIQKGYSPDLPAAFSGGTVDIRTLSIPGEFLLQAEIGSNYNTATSGDVLSYEGGDDDWLGSDDGSRAMSETLKGAVDRYQGTLTPVAILQHENRVGNSITFQEAQQINRDLALELNRDISVEEESRDPNGSFQASVGNTFFLDNGMDIGFVAGGAYQSTWLNRDSAESSFAQPDDIFSERRKSTHNVNITGNLALGWSWFEDHSIETTSLFLRNTDDESSIRNYHTSSFLFSDGRGFTDFGTRFEERLLRVNQIRGSHRLGGVTRDLTGFQAFPWLDDMTLEWFYSDADSTTEIPNETSTTYQSRVDVDSGAILERNIQPNPTAGDFRFTDLDDQVENYGWDLDVPLYFANTEVVLRGGYNYAKKSREYQQLQYSLGTSSLEYAQSQTGLPGDVFSDANIQDPDSGLFTNIFANNGESYLAAVINTASYGEVDVTWNETWRLAIGARWEDYSQAGLPWDPIDYRGCQISCDADQLASSVFKDDDFYPSAALTWMQDDFWASQFQLRFNYSETLVRPDLREITPSSYIDPITDARVRGNANVVPATVKNYDIRAEWFFDSGDNFTISAFYKDIQDPIDFFETAAFEETLATEIINAESAEIAGFELEWLKNLSFLGRWADPFFVSGNVTVLDSELTAGNRADAPTNAVRPLAGASDHAVNLQMGYDSMDGRHSAMLVYNVFDDRLFFAGRNGSPDAYEQPFHSVDLTYFYYPTDRLTLRLRAKNLLDEEVEIQQDGVTTFFEEPGSTFSVDLRYSF